MLVNEKTYAARAVAREYASRLESVTQGGISGVRATHMQADARDRGLGPGTGGESRMRVLQNCWNGGRRGS